MPKYSPAIHTAPFFPCRIRVVGVPGPAWRAMPPVLGAVHRSRRLCSLHAQVRSIHHGLGKCRRWRRCRRFLAASEGSQTVLHLGTFVSDSRRAFASTTIGERARSLDVRAELTHLNHIRHRVHNAVHQYHPREPKILVAEVHRDRAVEDNNMANAGSWANPQHAAGRLLSYQYTVRSRAPVSIFATAKN